MNVQSNIIASERVAPARRWRVEWAFLPLLVGVLALVVPTLQRVAGVSWSTEQGAHGPIVLAIAVWLFVRRWPAIREAAVPGSPWLGGLALTGALLSYLVCRIIGSVTLESVSAYGALLSALYLFVGFRGMREAWFPILYFLFVLPPPGSWVAVATQPLRLHISDAAVSFLSLFGLPVAQSGLTIFIGQYTLEVRAACGGLNSLISLSAIGLFYAYIRHSTDTRRGSDLAYLGLLLCGIVVMAVLANFIRVVLLVLITYYLGNDAAQGFLHQFAGMVMFIVALTGTMALDSLLTRFRHSREQRA